MSNIKISLMIKNISKGPETFSVQEDQKSQYDISLTPPLL